ncbi:MAG: hypothetical protein ACOCV1_01605 [Bacillota bacterium]
MAKIFELTTNPKDGYVKWYVRGLKNESEARRLAKKAFENFYWDTAGAVSYYDDSPSKYPSKGYWKRKSLTKTEFLKETKIYRDREY